MKYVGSKRRIAKEIIPIILSERKDGQFYVEPFCGGMNAMEFVSNPRMANDSHFYLIEMWRALLQGWTPPDYISEDQYRDIRDRPCYYDPHLVGYVGFNSYGGKWWGGYRRDSKGERDYWKETSRHFQKQLPKLSGVKLSCCQYWEVEIPTESLIYCDPPYKGSLGYHVNFDHEKFWDWVRYKSKNNTVFVSEYEAPIDFECIYEKSIKNTLVQDTGAKAGTERLFRC